MASEAEFAVSLWVPEGTGWTEVMKSSNSVLPGSTGRAGNAAAHRFPLVHCSHGNHPGPERWLMWLCSSWEMLLSCAFLLTAPQEWTLWDWKELWQNSARLIPWEASWASRHRSHNKSNIPLMPSWKEMPFPMLSIPYANIPVHEAVLPGQVSGAATLHQDVTPAWFAGCVMQEPSLSSEGTTWPLKLEPQAVALSFFSSVLCLTLWDISLWTVTFWPGKWIWWLHSQASLFD